MTAPEQPQSTSAAPCPVHPMQTQPCPICNSFVVGAPEQPQRKVVPREPTPEMAQAGFHEYYTMNSDPRYYAMYIWRAMYDAAPDYNPTHHQVDVQWFNANVGSKENPFQPAVAAGPQGPVESARMGETPAAATPSPEDEGVCPRVGSPPPTDDVEFKRWLAGTTPADPYWTELCPKCGARIQPGAHDAKGACRPAAATLQEPRADVADLANTLETLAHYEAPRYIANADVEAMVKAAAAIRELQAHDAEGWRVAARNHRWHMEDKQRAERLEQQVRELQAENADLREEWGNEPAWLAMKTRAERAEARWTSAFATLREARPDTTEVNWLSVLREVIAHAGMIPGAQATTASLVEQLERAEAERDAAQAEGERIATRRWAHWKDGVQYVGSCGTTLKEALAEIDAALARASGEK